MKKNVFFRLLLMAMIIVSCNSNSTEESLVEIGVEKFIKKNGFFNIETGKSLESGRFSLILLITLKV